MISATADYETFKQRIKGLTGLDLFAYKQEQMERRLRALMERVGAENFAKYFKMLEGDAVLLREFMDRVTINVSELFRNPEQYRILEARVIPDLLSRTSQLKLWSAGCSYGQEPYSLAIILEELAGARGNKIIATDIDDKALQSAQRGVFSIADAKSVSKPRFAKWFTVEGQNVKADERLKSAIRFSKLDLLKDVFPTGLDLILCRNVVIYFTEETKARLYTRFFNALKPGGYLFVGGTERIAGYQEIGYKNAYPFFYQKPLNK